MKEPVLVVGREVFQQNSFVFAESHTQYLDWRVLDRQQIRQCAVGITAQALEQLDDAGVALRRAYLALAGRPWTDPDE